MKAGSVGAIFMSAQQYGMMFNEFSHMVGGKFIVNMVPMYIHYTDRNQTSRQVMYFVNSVDVCMLFYLGKVTEEYLLNVKSVLRNDFGNVKTYKATTKSEVLITLLILNLF
jgi:hypothetical protein